ncbi:BRO-N domain-containing protein [Rhodococcus xishaensis]|uniref:Bro-N domain-containing protein n=1 Tax=Rhodococcus xishaensis TaxID=2487364 RepID=A0A3S3E0C1_9NOCA|nr:hypothetical protein [Rhodococcus xishaensis]RVW03033.1 hypothetical protein EGT50_10010 [Rhodococcus xishaensis]
MTDHTTQLEPFHHEDAQVRVINIDREPWFVLVDLCLILRFGIPHEVAERIDSDARSLAPVIDSRGRAVLADSYRTSSAGSRLVSEAKKTFGMNEEELRALPLEQRRVFARHAERGTRMCDQYSEFGPHVNARETVMNHTWGSRNHCTLRVTPRGRTADGDVA